MFLIRLQGKESIFEQIRNQISDYIVKGLLQPNDKLPSVRQIANELGINPNTVMKAYHLLEEEGLIYTLDKKGAFVSNKVCVQVPVSDLHCQLMRFKEQGMSKTEVLKVVEEVYKEEKCLK